MTQGSRLAAIMADHDRGTQYALVECRYEECINTAKITDSVLKTDKELIDEFTAMGWSVKPTLCPEHQHKSQ